MAEITLTSWEQKLLKQLRQGYKPYSLQRLDLSIARTNEKLVMCGDNLSVVDVSDPDNVATVRLNKDSNDVLPLYDGVEITGIFHELYITNTAQAGAWIDIVSGVEFSYRKGKLTKVWIYD